MLLRPGLLLGPGAPPASEALLLDTYTGAAAAYSLRKLRAGYSGSLIRVRENGGDTEEDIGADSSGNLDTVALLDHTGSNSGFIPTFYDQVGSVNPTMATAGNQKRIVNAGTVDTFGGNSRPSIGNFISTPYTVSSAIKATSSVYTIFCVCRTNTNGEMFDNNSGSARLIAGAGRSNGAFYDQSAFWEGTAATASTYSVLTLLLLTGGSAALYQNGSAVSTGLTYNGAPIGAATDFFQSIERFQELIIFDSDQSANRTAIESDINTYYSIY